MSYEGSGEVSATFRPSTGPDLQGTRDSMTFVAPGSVTRRQFGLFRRDMQPGAGGPDPHLHRTFSESFYVISGTVRFYDGSGWIEAEAGDFLYVPKGGIHAFRADDEEPASMLIIFAPGTARERFFSELEQIRRDGRQLTETEWTELFARHDQYMVPAK